MSGGEEQRSLVPYSPAKRQRESSEEVSVGKRGAMTELRPPEIPRPLRYFKKNGENYTHVPETREVKRLDRNLNRARRSFLLQSGGRNRTVAFPPGNWTMEIPIPERELRRIEARPEISLDVVALPAGRLIEPLRSDAVEDAPGMKEGAISFEDALAVVEREQAAKDALIAQARYAEKKTREERMLQEAARQRERELEAARQRERELEAALERERRLESALALERRGPSVEEVARQVLRNTVESGPAQPDQRQLREAEKAAAARQELIVNSIAELERAKQETEQVTGRVAVFAANLRNIINTEANERRVIQGSEDVVVTAIAKIMFFARWSLIQMIRVLAEFMKLYHGILIEEDEEFENIRRAATNVGLFKAAADAKKEADNLIENFLNPPAALGSVEEVSPAARDLVSIDSEENRFAARQRQRERNGAAALLSTIEFQENAARNDLAMDEGLEREVIEEIARARRFRRH